MTKSTVLGLILIAVACFLCYFNSLDCGFVFDDPYAIGNNKDILPTTPLSNIFLNDFWGTPLAQLRSHGSYRPICTLTFRLQYLFSKLNPWSYHLVNVLLHCVVTLMTYWCLNVLSFSSASCFVATLLFGLHPIHTEAVTWVVGRAELMSAVFFFSTIIFYVEATKRRNFTKAFFLLVSCLSIPLAALSKETGITAVGMLFIYEFITQVQWKLSRLGNLLDFGPLLRLSAVTVVTFNFLMIRFTLMPNLPSFISVDNPAALAPTPIRELTHAYLVPLNVKQLIYPWGLAADWSMGTVPLITGLDDPRNIVTLAFFLGLLFAFEFLLKDNKLALCFAFIILPFIPASNLFFYVGFVLAERVLYLPSFGWCGLVALGFDRLSQKFSARKSNHRCLRRTAFYFLTLLLVVVSVAFFARSFVRNYDWMDEFTLYRSGIRVHDNNAKFYFNTGDLYEREGKLDEALAYYYKTIKILPVNFDRAHQANADVLRFLNHPKFSERALRHLLHLIETTPKAKRKVQFADVILPNVMLELAALITNTSTVDENRLLEAEEIYAEVAKMLPLRYCLSGFQRRGEIFFHLKRYDEARKMFTIILEHYSDCVSCLYNLAVVNLTSSSSDSISVSEALTLLEKSIEIDPEHYYAMQTYAGVVLKLRKVELYDKAMLYARQVAQYETLQKLTLPRTVLGLAVVLPATTVSNWGGHITAALLEYEVGSFAEAAKFLEAAVALDSSSESAAVKLSWLLYRDLSKPNEALTYVNALLEKNPSCENAWLIYGYIHLSEWKDKSKARLALKKVLENTVVQHPQPDDGPLLSVSLLEFCFLLERSNNLADESLKCYAELFNRFPDDAGIDQKLKQLKSY